MTQHTTPIIVVFYDDDWDCPLWTGAALDFLDIADVDYYICNHNGDMSDKQSQPVGHVHEFIAQRPDEPIVWVGKNIITDLEPRPHDTELLSIVDVFEWLWQRRREL